MKFASNWNFQRGRGVGGLPCSRGMDIFWNHTLQFLTKGKGHKLLFGFSCREDSTVCVF